MDWLEDLSLEVPETYEELTEVLKTFKTEKGAGVEGTMPLRSALTFCKIIQGAYDRAHP